MPRVTTYPSCPALPPQVLSFLSKLLNDAALTTRLSGPIAHNTADEAGVAIAYANAAGVCNPCETKGVWVQCW